MEKPIYNHRKAEEILRSSISLHKEIMEIVKAIDVLEHEHIKSLFKLKGWSTEEPISDRPLNKAWRYDAFKERVAIEVEKGGQAYRSFLKFMLGYNEGKIDLGIIILPYKESGTKGHPMSVTERELEDLRVILPMPILLIGIPI